MLQSSLPSLRRKFLVESESGVGGNALRIEFVANRFAEPFVVA
jgi:hypothetical protein